MFCYMFYQSEGWERISAPPGHVISQGLGPGVWVVTCRGSGRGGGDLMCPKRTFGEGEMCVFAMQKHTINT